MVLYRCERDALGEVQVPDDALYGAQTQRAIQNFPISGLRFPPIFISTLGQIKWCAASINEGLGVLDGTRAASIREAAAEVIAGQWDDHFPVDVFQTGSGTSTNMNANEVIARRAEQLLAEAGHHIIVHPNDHVNRSQSSNDVIPTAIHLAVSQEVSGRLLPALRHLQRRIWEKSRNYQGLMKTGRTHLMDATPVRVSDEMAGWAHQIGMGTRLVERSMPDLMALAIGGTAVGTGVNAPPGFGRQMGQMLAERLGLPFREASNHFAAQSSLDAVVALSGQVKAVSTSLFKIANDIRWLASGPVSGLGELELPALQPGSSIMPGKVNPVVCEATIMACVQVMANDAAIGFANSQGSFQLNVLMPLMAYNILQSVAVLANVSRLLADLVVAGLEVREERLRNLVGRNPMIVTSLAPVIGYDKASEIAHRAYVEGLPIRDVAAEMTGLSPTELDELLDIDRLVGGRSDPV
jgi:fumarate hydratase, class II